MAYEHKEGQGALFKNEKGGVEARPDYKGNILVNGSLMELAAWVKTAKSSGKKFLSVQLSERKTVSQAMADNAHKQYEEPQPEQPEDDLPF